MVGHVLLFSSSYTQNIRFSTSYGHDAFPTNRPTSQLQHKAAAPDFQGGARSVSLRDGPTLRRTSLLNHRNRKLCFRSRSRSVSFRVGRRMLDVIVTVQSSSDVLQVALTYVLLLSHPLKKTPEDVP